jgi:glutaconate CoA-transferase subunit A
VTVERIVDELHPRPGALILPGWVITCVAEAADGSWPSYSLGITERDNSFYRAWDVISRDREKFLVWMEERVISQRVRAI